MYDNGYFSSIKNDKKGNFLNFYIDRNSSLEKKEQGDLLEKAAKYLDFNLKQLIYFLFGLGLISEEKEEYFRIKEKNLYVTLFDFISFFGLAIKQKKEIQNVNK